MTEERQMIKDTAAQFTNEVVLPAANELDPVKGKIPREIIDQMGELGFFGIKAPIEDGGSGMGCFEYCLIAEELCRGWMSVGSIIARSDVSTVKKMKPHIQERLIPKMVMGQYLFAAALSEPDVGSDLSGIKCRAEKDGDHYVITGSKYWCTFGDQADALFLLARTDKEVDPKRPYKGISAFIIEKERGSFPARPEMGFVFRRHSWNRHPDGWSLGL